MFLSMASRTILITGQTVFDEVIRTVGELFHCGQCFDSDSLTCSKPDCLQQKI
jgi:hypothetical protein